MGADASLICDGLIDHTIKSGLVIGLVLLACKTLEPKLSAATRKYALLFTTLAVLLLPLLGRWAPQQSEIRIWTVWRSSQQESEGNQAAGPANSSAGTPSTDTGGNHHTWLEGGGPVKLAAGVWLIGVALLGLRWAYQLVFAEWTCHRTRTGAAPCRALDAENVFAQLGRTPCPNLASTPTAYLVPDLTSAIVLGLVRPLVLLPQQFAAWPAEQQYHVLRHEFCHVKQRDMVWLQLATLATIIFWFNPLVWQLKRRLQLEQERSCDDEVIRSGVKASNYSETLLAAFEAQVGSSHPPAEEQTVEVNATPEDVDPAFSSESTRQRPLARLGRDRRADLLNERVRAVIDAYYNHAPANIMLCALAGLLTLVCSWQLAGIRFATTWLGVSPVTLEIRITSTSDDAEERIEDGHVDLASRDLEMPYDVGRGRHQVIGLRFDHVDIPRGARIGEATIAFTALKSLRGNAKLDIRIQLDPAPETFRARRKDITNRVSAKQPSLPWSTLYSGTPPNVETTTPDLSEMVQAVVDQRGWKAGNALVFVISGELGEICSAVSYDSQTGALHAPRLRVTFVDEVSGLLLPRQD